MVRASGAMSTDIHVPSRTVNVSARTVGATRASRARCAERCRAKNQRRDGGPDSQVQCAHGGDQESEKRSRRKRAMSWSV
jgi:hypothetical protein